MRSLLARLIVVLSAVLSLVALPPAAQATPPGKNGKIVFSTIGADGREIWTVNPDGTGRVSGGFLGVLSPDGSKLAFSASRSADHREAIFTSNADGTGRTDLTPSPDQGFNFLPAWSPDASKIVFGTNRDDLTGIANLFQLYVMNADGTGQSRLTHSSFYDQQPSWSPDGKSIVFTRVYDAQQGADIYRISPDGTDEKQLTTDRSASYIAFPDWSPDGSKIVYVGVSGNSRGDIRVMNPDGSGQKTLVPDNGLSFRISPLWSPDGTKIAFLSKGPETNGDRGLCGAISVVNADGTGLQALNTDCNSSLIRWELVPAPKRTKYKNSNKFCKAEQAFWGDQFGQHYRNFGQCVSGR